MRQLFHNALQRQQEALWWWLSPARSSRSFSPCTMGRSGLACVSRKATVGHPADWGRTRESPPSHSLRWSQTTSVNPFMTPERIKSSENMRLLCFCQQFLVFFFLNHDWTGILEHTRVRILLPSGRIKEGLGPNHPVTTAAGQMLQHPQLQR